MARESLYSQISSRDSIDDVSEGNVPKTKTSIYSGLKHNVLKLFLLSIVCNFILLAVLGMAIAKYPVLRSSSISNNENPFHRIQNSTVNANYASLSKDTDYLWEPWHWSKAFMVELDGEMAAIAMSVHTTRLWATTR